MATLRPSAIGYSAAPAPPQPRYGGGGGATSHAAAGGGPSEALLAQLLGAGSGGDGSVIPGTNGVIQGRQPAPGAPTASGAGSDSGVQSAPASTNTAAPNPVTNGVVNDLLNRAKDPTMGAGAYDLGIQKIRANASQGIGKEMAASRAARGVSGGGLDDIDARGLAQNQEAQIGSLTADFLAKREGARDQLLGQAGNLGLGQGNQQQQQQQINYAQYNADRDAAFREKASHNTNLMNILSLLTGPSWLNSGSNLNV